jgi:hypothetical protein
MPISHASYIHKPEDYVAPVDLNLMGKVLQYKQGEFDAGVAKEQGAIDSAASLDMVRGVDKDYLNSKINSLVDTVNNIGGADFSDPNITNQIAGLSSQIYNDPNIINAVAGTKQFRYVQDQYKQLKEKHPKDWNPANEWYDMNKFQDWFQDSRVGAPTSSGAGEITPYTRYEDDWQKTFDKITQNANVSQEITDKGLMYRIDTHKLVSPDRIWDTAQKMLTPEQRQQLAIEGRYQYQGLPVSELTKAYDADTYKKVGQQTSQLDDYKAKLKGALNIADQDKYQQLIDETNSNISKLVAPVKKNAEQIKENLYLNDKLKGLADRYAFDQTTTKLQPATDKMFKLKYEMDKQKFAYEQGKDNKQQEIEMAKDGLMYYQDPLTGQTTIIQDPNARQNKLRGKLGADGKPDYSGLPGYQAAPTSQTNTVTKDTLDSRKTDLTTANQKLMLDYAQSLGWRKGDASVTVTDLMPDGHLNVNLNPEMKTAMQQAMSAWDAMSQGKKINYDQLDPRFKQFGAKYQENLKEIEAIDDFTGTIDKQIMTKYGVDPDKLAKYNRVQDAIKNAQFSRSSDVAGAAGSSAMHQQVMNNADAHLQQVLSQEGVSPYGSVPGVDPKAVQQYYKNRVAERNTLIGSASEVFRLPTTTVDDDKQKNLAKMLAGNVTGGNLHVYDQHGKTLKDASNTGLNPDNIEVQSKGYKMLEGNLTPVFNIKYKTGPKPENFALMSIPVDKTQQDLLGFGSDQDLTPTTGYNFALRLNGQVKGLITTSGRNYDLKYDIVKYNPSDPNDQGVFVRIYKGDKPIVLDNLYLPTYQHGINFVEGLTKEKTIDDVFNKIQQIAPSNK